jgi:diguanylate cyclase (GGDEF)-like protein
LFFLLSFTPATISAQLSSRHALSRAVAQARALPAAELDARINRLPPPDRDVKRDTDRSTEIVLRLARLQNSAKNSAQAAADLQRIAAAANALADPSSQRLVYAELASALGNRNSLSPPPDAQAQQQLAAAERMRRQLRLEERNQQFQIDAMTHRSQLQSALNLVLAICLLLAIALAWSLWRINLARRQQALEDPLTGLKNRRFLAPFMEHETQRLRRSRHSALILILDIDYFKRVNDRFGHEAGDEALKQMADILRNCVRNADVVARWGGEEFVLFCPQSGVEHAQVICNRIRTRLQVTPIQAPGHPSFPLTVSIGAALFSPATTAELWDASLARADRALYQVKQNGRDSWSLAEPVAIA